MSGDVRVLLYHLRHGPLTPVLVALLIGMHAWTIIPNMIIPDKEPDYYYFVLYNAYICDPTDFPYLHDNPITARNQIKWWFSCISYHWLDNPKIIPLLFNIGIMPLVYLVAVALTKDRLIGLIAISAFVRNPLYTDWEGSATYDQTWAFFLLLGLWVSFHSRLGVISYGVAILTKGLSLFYVPVLLYSSYMIRKNKVEIVVLCGFISVLVLFALQYSNIVGNEIGFYPDRWPEAIFRNISVLWQVIPFLAVIIVLNRTFIPKNHNIPNMGIIWAWIGIILLQNPIISFFTLQDTYSYRYVPLAMMMSVLLGCTIIQIGHWYAEIQLKKTQALKTSS